MIENSSKNRIKIILAAVAVVLFIFFSEGVYVFSHRDVLSFYILRSAQFVSKQGNTRLALLILTEGRAKIPYDSNFGNSVKSYLESAPNNYDLARVDYDLAVLASKNNFLYLTPKLLQISIQRDPDFSFWRVELANYYLSIGGNISAEAVLNDCLQVSAPRQHCLNYKNEDFVNNITHPVGFLVDSINTFYKSSSN